MLSYRNRLALRVASVQGGRAVAAAAVASAVGASSHPSGGHGARAVILVAALYGLSVACGTGGQLFVLRFAFVQAHPWLLSIAFGLISILTFSAAGILCYRRFVNTLSPRAAG